MGQVRWRDEVFNHFFGSSGRVFHPMGDASPHVDVYEFARREGTQDRFVAADECASELPGTALLERLFDVGYQFDFNPYRPSAVPTP